MADKGKRATVQVNSAMVNLIERFNGGGQQDAHRWFATFEGAADLFGWDEEQRTKVLPLVLTGEAAALFHDLPAATKAKFTDARAALITAFGDAVEPLLLLDQLADRKLRPGEDIKAYARAVIQLCHRVDPAMKDRDKIAAFMRGLPRDMRTHVAMTMATGGPSTFAEVVALVRRIEAIQGDVASMRPSLPSSIVASVSAGDLGDGASSAARVVPAANSTAAPTTLTDGTRAGSIPLEDRIGQLVEVLATFTASVTAGTKSRPPQDRDSPSNAARCHFCGKPGHVLKDCWHRLREQGQQGPESAVSRPPRRFAQGPRDRSPRRSYGDDDRDDYRPRRQDHADRDSSREYSQRQDRDRPGRRDGDASSFGARKPKNF